MWFRAIYLAGENTQTRCKETVHEISVLIFQIIIPTGMEDQLTGGPAIFGVLRFQAERRGLDLLETKLLGAKVPPRCSN